MSHPCVVTLDPRSRPRVLLAGDELVEVALPAGARCLYPRPPLQAPVDFPALLQAALGQPLHGPALAGRIDRSSKVTLVLGNPLLPQPPMSPLDVRQRLLTELLDVLDARGVDDVQVIVASGAQRKLLQSEIEQALGSSCERLAGRLHCHDSEDAGELREIGAGVLINRRVAESDLVITVQLAGLPDGDPLLQALPGVAGMQWLRAQAQPARDQGAGALWSNLGQPIVAALGDKLFAIEVALDGGAFERPFAFLARNEDDLSTREYGLLRTLVATTARLPRAARRTLLARLSASHGVRAVFAGSATAVRDAARHHLDQERVPLPGQADVLIAPVGPFSPYNAGCVQNPLLVMAAALEQVQATRSGPALVKRGGTLIVLHSCTDQFDRRQHTAHKDFVHRLLPETRDGIALRDRYEERFASNPALVEMFRHGQAYHPAHPFWLWYRSELARRHLGRVIVVGADNEYVPQRLGCETAVSMQEALYKARGESQRALDITCLHGPFAVAAEVVSEEREEGSA